MEKPTKPRNKIFNFLSSAIISFQNFQFGPTQLENPANKINPQTRKGFSGPIKISVVPPEARRRNNLSSGEGEFQEPSSPKISCIGEIKIKNKNKNQKKKTVMKPHVRRSKSDVSAHNLPDKVPAIGQMRRFVSGRDKLQGFDWRAQVAPEYEDNHRRRKEDKQIA